MGRDEALDQPHFLSVVDAIIHFHLCHATQLIIPPNYTPPNTTANTNLFLDSDDYVTRAYSKAGTGCNELDDRHHAIQYHLYRQSIINDPTNADSDIGIGVRLIDVKQSPGRRSSGAVKRAKGEDDAGGDLFGAFSPMSSSFRSPLSSPHRGGMMDDEDDADNGPAKTPDMKRKQKAGKREKKRRMGDDSDDDLDDSELDQMDQIDDSDHDQQPTPIHSYDYNKFIFLTDELIEYLTALITQRHSKLATYVERPERFFFGLNSLAPDG